MLRQALLPALDLPMPCRRLAVNDAVAAAWRAELLDGDGHVRALSRAARHPRTPTSLADTPENFQPATGDPSRA
jgi:hypothetical protein